MARDRRVRTTGWTASSGHSGNAPKHLGEEIKFPEGHPNHGVGCTVTREEYYAYREEAKCGTT